MDEIILGNRQGKDGAPGNRDGRDQEHHHCCRSGLLPPSGWHTRTHTHTATANSTGLPHTHTLTPTTLSPACQPDQRHNQGGGGRPWRGKTYWSSGVNCTGSAVNWGSKFSRSLSPSTRGLKGVGICFLSSWKQPFYWVRVKNKRS